MTPDRPISALFCENRPLRSLEFFPPKDDEGVVNLRSTAAALQRIGPDFVSVTYGAGGSTRERTAQVQRSARVNGARYDGASPDLGVRDRELASQARDRAWIWDCDAEADAEAALATR